MQWSGSPAIIGDRGLIPGPGRSTSVGPLSPCACAQEPGSGSYRPGAPQSPGSSHRRSHHNVKPADHNTGQRAHRSWRKPSQAMKAQHGQKKKKKSINEMFLNEKENQFFHYVPCKLKSGDTAGGLRSIQTRVLRRQQFCAF